jgi:hypothetical protein
MTDVRTEVEAVSAAIAVRVNALEQDTPSGGVAEMSGAEGKGRGAGLWKLLEASLKEQDTRILERVGSRCDAVDAGIKRCDTALCWAAQLMLQLHSAACQAS